MITVCGANRPTDGLGGNSQQHEFFNQLTVTVKSPDGATVRTLQGSFQLQHPISTQNDTPNDPVWVPFEYTIEWDGMVSLDGQTYSPAPNAQYTFVATMTTVRFKKPNVGQGAPPDHTIGSTSPKPHTATVDSTPPQIAGQSPAPDSLTDSVQMISVTWSDPATGIDLATGELFFDNNDVTASSTKTAEGISFSPPQWVEDGFHSCAVRVKDLAGNQAESIWQFRKVSAVETITAAQGGIVEVTEAGNPLLGARLEIPPGAFAQDGVVVITLSPTPPAPDAGLFNPSGTTVSIECGNPLSTPVLLTLPYDEAPVFERGLNEGVVRLYHFAPALADWQMLPHVSTDAEANLVTASISSFSDFQPGIPVPANLAKVSGDNQFAPPNSKFGEPMVTRLTDQAGNPLGGWEVKYERTAGAGNFDPPEILSAPLMAGLAAAAAGEEVPTGTQGGGVIGVGEHMVDAIGTEFRVTAPDGREIVMQSTEQVRVLLEAVGEMLSYVIERIEPVLPSAPGQTTITIHGLEPSTTLYKYEDSYANEIVLEIGADGECSYTQDIGTRHRVFFQPTKGTIYLYDTGPSKPVGIWIPATKTLTLTQDVTETISIQANGVTLDGGGHSIVGSGSGYGIEVGTRSNVTIRNCRVSKFTYGMMMFVTSNSTLESNSVSQNNYGVYITNSQHNSLCENIVSSNQTYGIYLSRSFLNTLASDTVEENGQNDLWVYASSDEECVNTVTDMTGSGGRPILYFYEPVNIDGLTVSELVLCNADNSVISNVTIAGSDTLKNNGLFAMRTESSTFEAIVSCWNYVGISLDDCSLNTISGGTLNDNASMGATIRGVGTLVGTGKDNILTGSEARRNNVGIQLLAASGTKVRSSQISANTLYGIYVGVCPSAEIEGNLIESNGLRGIFADWLQTVVTPDLLVTGNTIRLHQCGLYLFNVPKAVVYQNNILANTPNVSSNWALELSFNQEGNYWGHTAPPGFYVYGGPNTPYDSNRADVVDSFPYLQENGWDFPPPPAEPVFVFTDENGLATPPLYESGAQAGIEEITATVLHTDAGQPPLSVLFTAVVDGMPPTGSIAIDSGAQGTTSTAVTLNLTYADPESGVTGMCFSDDGVAFTPWETPASTKAWALTPGDGLKTVWVRYQNGAGLISMYSDDIILDTTTPTGSITINVGAQWTSSTTVTLNLQYADLQTGVTGMRFSNDGTIFSNWETPAPLKPWTLTPGDGLKTVWVQYKNGAGLVFTCSDDITLETTPPTGSVAINNGAQWTTSTAVTLNLLYSDPQSGVTGVCFSNDGTAFTIWETPAPTKAWALKSGDGSKTVWVQYKNGAGAVFTCSDNITLETTPPVGSVNINSGAQWTSSPAVTLNLLYSDPQSGVTGMCFSNDGLIFSGWETPALLKAWTLTPGDGLKTVWVRYQNGAGLFSTYSDGITLDTTPPTGSITINSGAQWTTSTAVTLNLLYSDLQSGVTGMCFSNDGLIYSAWETPTPLKAWTLTTGDGLKTVWARYQNGAGLVSTYLDDIMLDTTPPAGSIAINNGALWTNSTTVTLDLQYVDPESGVVGMRVANYETALSMWEPPAPTKTWILTTGDGPKTVWVQYKNNAGLISTYSDDITFDAMPPAAPTGLIATPGDGQVMLTWNANLEPDLAGYEVYMGPTPGTKINPGLVPPSPTPSYLVTGLTNGETYLFAIVAVDAAGNRGAFSEPASATPCADTVPPTITTFSLFDLTSNHTDWTNSQTIGVNIAADGTGSAIIRWLLREDSAPPTVDEMLAALTSQPSQYTTQSPDGQVTVYAWVMDSANNISSAAQCAIGLDTVLPVTTDFALEDSTSGSTDYTDDSEVSLQMTLDDVNPIVRWMLTNDPETTDAPSEADVWTDGLTSCPATWTLPDTAGEHIVMAWAMDIAGNIGLTMVTSIEYVVLAGPGFVGPPEGFVVRPMVPLVLEVVGLDPAQPITWSCDRGVIEGHSPSATYYNAGSGSCTVIVEGSISTTPITLRTKVTVDPLPPGGQGDHKNLTGGHRFEIPVARTYSGKGFLLNLEIAYNSHAQEPREYFGMSYNWTHSYDIFIHALKGDRIELKDGTGGRVVFCRDFTVSGKYTAYDNNHLKNPYGNYSEVFSYLPIGQTDPVFGLYHYKMTTKSRTEYYFRQFRGDNVEQNKFGKIKEPAYVVGIRDTNGNVMRFTYTKLITASSRRTALVSVTDSANRSVVFSYEPVPQLQLLGPGWRVKQINDPANNVTILNYNPAGYLAGVEQETPTGSTSSPAIWEFTYYQVEQKRFRHVENKTDPNGNTSRYTFVAFPGRQAHEEYLNEQLVIRCDRNPSSDGSPTTITNANNNTRVEDFDPFHNAWTHITDEENYEIMSTFDNVRNLLTEMDRNGVLRTHTYDDRGNRLTTRVTTGEVGINEVVHNYEEFEYQSDLLRFHRGPVLNEGQTGELAALTTEYQYDARRNLILTIEPQGQAGQRRTRFFYNTAGQVTEGWRGTIADSTCKQQYVYDPATGHLLRQIDDPNGEHIETGFEYDVLGQKIKTCDGNGNITKFVYDRFGRVVRIIGPCANESELAQREAAGQYVQNTRDGNGNLVETRDELGHATTYEYNDLNLQTRVTQTVGIENLRTIYEYDYMGNRTKVIDARTGDGSYSALMEYDKLGRLKKTTQRLGSTGVPPVDSIAMTEYLLDGNGNQLKVFGPRAPEEEPNSIVTENTYDQLNRLVSTKDPMLYVSSQTYDPRGNVLTTTDARGNTTTNTYDHTNRLVKRTQPPPGQPPSAVVTTFTYDIEGNLLSTTGPWYDTNGNGSPDQSDLSEESYSSYSTYDGLNRLLTSRIGDHPPTSYEYDKNNNVTRVTDPMGHETTSEYNPRNQVVLQQNHLGEKNRHQYDLVGNRVATLTASDTTLETRTDFLYDALNRLVETRVYPDKQDPSHPYSTCFTYDQVGNKIKERDAKGNETYFEYDAANRLVKTIDALGHDIESAYDARGNRTSIWDQNNNQTSFVYDLDNRLITITEPSDAGGASVTNMEYDKVGNLTKRINPNEQTLQSPWSILRTYDALNRLMTVTYRSGAIVSFTYDARGNRRNLVDGNAGVQYSYQYNDRGLLTQFANQTWSKILGYEYDAAGKRTQMATPEGDVITYTHDAADRIDTITRGTQLVADYDYDLAGRREKLTLGNGCYTNYAYDDLNRLEDVHNRRADDETISSFTYTHDEVNNRASITFANGDKVSFEYDALSRLTTEARIGQVAYNEGLAYSVTGNRTHRIRTTPSGTYTTDYAYNSANQLTSETTNDISTDYLYDANGNIVQKSTPGLAIWNYAYDFENRQIGVTNSSGLTSAYLLDYDSRRLSKTVNGDVERFLHDGDDIVADYTASGSLKSCYVNSVTIDSKLLRIGGPASSTPGAEHYYHYDALGSVVSLTSGGIGQPTENTYYTNAWGEDLTQLESLPEQFEDIVPGSAPNVVADRYQFTGRERDAESRLMHYRKRTYDPRTGRFLQKDPKGMPEGPNRYVYLSNDPINAVDPYGLQQMERKISDEWIEAKKKGDIVGGGVAIAKALGYSIWNVLSGGSLERQGELVDKSVRGEISENQYIGGTLWNFARSITHVAASAGAGKYIGPLVKAAGVTDPVIASGLAGALGGATVTAADHLITELDSKPTVRPPGLKGYFQSITMGFLYGALTGLSEGDNAPSTQEQSGVQAEKGRDLPTGTLEDRGTDLATGREPGTSGRSANRLPPDPNATGAHTTFRRDPESGEVTHYQTWEPQSNPRDPHPWEPTIRFDATGGAHYNKVIAQDIETPHVHDPSTPGGIRSPRPEELPK
ncbi:MAG: NosD domain-containing protein [Planctomycetota bacterium]|nr:NosD domain-containing protein [Planctomycetota bacterium]